jgi:hypothetical protein
LLVHMQPISHIAEAAFGIALPNTAKRFSPNYVMCTHQRTARRRGWAITLGLKGWDFVAARRRRSAFVRFLRLALCAPSA